MRLRTCPRSSPANVHFRSTRVAPHSLRRVKRPSVARLHCLAHASPHAPPAHVATTSHDEVEEDDTALRVLGFLSAGGEALSSVVPPNLVNACYLLAAANVGAETAARCREHVRKNWGAGAAGDAATASERDVLLAQGCERRREKAVRASRKALQRGAVKLLTTVALPTLIMHGLTHSGWDMFTNAAGLTDAVAAAAGQLAHALHLPHHDIAEALARAVPNLAGSFVLPILAKPLEKVVENYLQTELRPALDEFMTRGMSMTSGPSALLASRSLSRCVSGGWDGASFSVPSGLRGAAAMGGASFGGVGSEPSFA